MLQFERAKENIKGHGVMITSWYDADASTWRASAPGHLHLLRNARPVVITGGSRQQAIKRLSEALRAAFMNH